MTEHRHVWFLSNPTYKTDLVGPDEVIVTVKCMECVEIGDACDVNELLAEMQDEIDDLHARLSLSIVG